MNYEDVANELETLSVPEAAIECGMTIDEFFSQMVLDGVLVPTGDDEYEMTGHPDLVPREVPEKGEHRIVANVENLLQAFVAGSKFQVKVSPIIDDEDSLYAPVSEFLSTHQTEIVSTEEVEDDMWMFGKYERTVYRVLPE